MRDSPTQSAPDPLVHVVKNGPRISATHVGSSGSHRDDSELLRLDGIAHR